MGGEFRSGEVSEVEGLDLGGVHGSVGKGFLARRDREAAEVFVRECPERGFAGSDDRDRASVIHLNALYTEHSAHDFPKRLAFRFVRIDKGCRRLRRTYWPSRAGETGT